MADPVYISIGSYAREDDAKSDFDVVRNLYRDDVVRNYDAAVSAWS